MTNALRSCPKCHWPLEAGDSCFCPHCGGEVGEAILPVTGPETPAAAGIERDARPLGTASPNGSNDSDCHELEILYNVSRLFVEGLEMPFQFRITPLREEISDLCIEIRRRQSSPGGELLVARDEPAWFPVRGKTMENPVGFRPEPGSAGHVTFDIYVGYQSSGIRKWYLTRKTHTVFQPKTQAESVARELNIQFHNELSQGHAGDAQVHQTLQGLETLIHAKKDYVEDFRGVDVPELWVRLPLARCQYKPLSGKPTGPVHSRVETEPFRLKLRGPGGVIHLLSGSILTMGRSRENDVVTRVTLADGSTPTGPNERISRYHAQIQRQGNRCMLIDRGCDPVTKVAKPSAMGIMLDDRPVPRGQSVSLPMDRDFSIALAPAGHREEEVYVLEGRVWTCGMVGGMPGCRKLFSAHEPAGLVLHSRGNPGELYALLWAYLPLSRIVPQWSESCVCRTGDGFMMEAGGRCDCLVPGGSVSLPMGKSISVANYGG